MKYCVTLYLVFPQCVTHVLQMFINSFDISQMSFSLRINSKFSCNILFCLFSFKAFLTGIIICMCLGGQPADI